MVRCCCHSLLPSSLYFSHLLPLSLFQVNILPTLTLNQSWGICGLEFTLLVIGWAWLVWPRLNLSWPAKNQQKDRAIVDHLGESTSLSNSYHPLHNTHFPHFKGLVPPYHRLRHTTDYWDIFAFCFTLQVHCCKFFFISVFHLFYWHLSQNKMRINISKRYCASSVGEINLSLTLL